MIEICFASNNSHKLSEVRQIIGPDFRILSLSDIGCEDDLPETSDSFQGNASQKAEYVRDKFGIECFADDSGLVVPSLNGEPGVYSARYAGLQRSDSDNITLLLERLSGKPDRSAYFIACIALTRMTGTYVFEGKVAGSILADRRGTSGFGYDPVFQPDGYVRTFAEMTMEEKSELSHRGIAARHLAKFLNEHYLS